MQRNKSTIIWIIVIVIVLVALFAYPRTKHPNGGVANTVPCLTPNIPLQQHIHPLLRIMVDNRDEVIPAQIGLSTCEHAIHTHDTTGTIHVEAQDTRTYVLGDFFSVWGKTIDREGYALHVTLDEKPFAGDLTTITLKDGEKILMSYTKLENSK